jgi:phage shock protein A
MHYGCIVDAFGGRAIHLKKGKQMSNLVQKLYIQFTGLMLDQLKARLQDLNQKLRDMQNRATMLDARSKVADAECRAARLLGNVGAQPGINFDQLEQQVDRKEAKAASLADMAEENAALNVDRRLAQAARREAIGAKLKALGIVPTGDMGAIASKGGSHA